MSLFAFTFLLVTALVLFSMAVSILAGVYPAIRAPRVDPSQALPAQ